MLRRYVLGCWGNRTDREKKEFKVEQIAKVNDPTQNPMVVQLNKVGEGVNTYMRDSDPSSPS